MPNHLLTHSSFVRNAGWHQTAIAHVELPLSDGRRITEADLSPIGSDQLLDITVELVE